jgi:GDP-4-dehydro-6-deoxy-D-mannose reductase
MKVLVLGASGFTARHLIENLSADPDNEVYCSSLSAEHETNWIECNLTVQAATDSLVEQVQPDQIYQLAGSFTNHYETDYLSNVVASRNILESVLKKKSDCRILLVGSAAEYGLVRPEDNPVGEDHPLNPISIYGLTKVYQTDLMRFFRNVHNADVVMARAFNLLGKGISDKLFPGAVHKQIDEYKAGQRSKIILGNLSHRRDYIKVEEAVKYYELIMKAGRAGEVYNVGSGQGIVIRDLLQAIMEENGLSMELVEERPVNDANKLDVKEVIADVTKLNSLAIASSKSIS